MRLCGTTTILIGGTGSNNMDEAIEMAKKYRADGYEDAYIAVIDDGDDPTCVDEIRDF